MSGGLHRLTGGTFYHARPECSSCSEQEYTGGDFTRCRARRKLLCCERERRGRCGLYVPVDKAARALLAKWPARFPTGTEPPK